MTQNRPLTRTAYISSCSLWAEKKPKWAPPEAKRAEWMQLALWTLFAPSPNWAHVFMSLFFKTALRGTFLLKTAPTETRYNPNWRQFTPPCAKPRCVPRPPIRLWRIAKKNTFFFLFPRLPKKHVFRAPTLELDYGEPRLSASRDFVVSSVFAFSKKWLPFGL